MNLCLMKPNISSGASKQSFLTPTVTGDLCGEKHGKHWHAGAEKLFAEEKNWFWKYMETKAILTLSFFFSFQIGFILRTVVIFRSICCSPARLHLIDCISFLLPNGRLKVTPCPYFWLCKGGGGGYEWQRFWLVSKETKEEAFLEYTPETTNQGHSMKAVWGRKPISSASGGSFRWWESLVRKLRNNRRRPVASWPLSSFPKKVDYMQIVSC